MPDATTGKMPGRMQENITTTERNASPMKTATSRNSTVRPRLSFSIMLALLRAAITDRPVTAISIARMLGTHLVERLVELVHHRKQRA